MDYSQMISYHEEQQSDLTIASKRVPLSEADRFGILDTNDNMKITSFEEKPESPLNNLASMGIYVFNTDVLIKILEAHCSQDNYDFGHHIIPEVINQGNTYSYEYKGYWRDVGTITSFWETNLELVGEMPKLDLYDDNWKIYTRGKEEPPAKFGGKAQIRKSIISNGSIINGIVENSVISPGVYIEEGAVIKNSVVLNNTIIKSGSNINKVIIDKDVIVGSDVIIGAEESFNYNQDKPDLYNNGLTIIGKNSRIPSGINIGNNCRILSYIKEDDFSNTSKVESGISVKPQVNHRIPLLEIG